ncbi:hypothetical protein HAX54_041818, partial [Datura stramonium]|nr:hypothetical protein [Datura stramonium]
FSSVNRRTNARERRKAESKKRELAPHLQNFGDNLRTADLAQAQSSEPWQPANRRSISLQDSELGKSGGHLHLIRRNARTHRRPQ